MTKQALVVEGQVVADDSLHTLFSRHPQQTNDIETISATSLAEATAILETASVDCILSRQNLPEETGVDLLETVRQEYPDVPFFLFVEGNLGTIAGDAIAADVTDYFPLAEIYSKSTVARIEDEITAHRGDESVVELLDSAPHAILVYDQARTAITAVNTTACEYWGYTKTEFQQQSLESLTAETQPPSDTPVNTLLEEAHNESPQGVDWRCKTKDGTQFWTELSIQPIQFKGKSHLVLHARDTTAEKERQERLESFRKAVEHAGHSIYITDTDAEITYVNETFEDVTGYTYSEAVGKTPRILKSGEHGSAYYQQLWRTILNGNTWQNEIINQRKDGTRYVVNQTIAPITDEHGTISRFVAVNAEVTERKRKENQLTQLYQAATEWIEANTRVEACSHVSDNLTRLLDFDLHGVYLYDEGSNALESVTVSDRSKDSIANHPTFGPGEGIAWEVYESGVPQQYDDVRTAEAVYNPETVIRSEIVLPLGDHGVILIGSKTPGAFDDDDELLAKVVSSILTAVLDRIEREQQLEEQNSRLEEFASVVSHDLRNPLNVANGHLELAQETGDLEHLDEIALSHQRMEEIIEDLLWLAQEGREIQRTRPIALESVAENAWSHVETADATLAIPCKQTIEADPDRLQQLFENLFRNAIEHGGDDVTVTVGSLASGTGFYVEDTGNGIPPDERTDVFDSGYTTLEESTGYGLSIVETIVDGHGWCIDLTASEEGGARFEIVIE